MRVEVKTTSRLPTSVDRMTRPFSRITDRAPLNHDGPGLSSRLSPIFTCNGSLSWRDRESGVYWKQDTGTFVRRRHPETYVTQVRESDDKCTTTSPQYTVPLIETLNLIHRPSRSSPSSADYSSSRLSSLLMREDTCSTNPRTYTHRHIQVHSTWFLRFFSSPLASEYGTDSDVRIVRQDKIVSIRWEDRNFKNLTSFLIHLQKRWGNGTERRGNGCRW